MYKKILRHLASPFTDPNQKRSSHGDSLYALDGLRGVAVLIVMASHTSAFGMLGQGSLGVLLFFMLSGFVLTLPYADVPNRMLSYRELWRFSINRVLRIMPIYLVAVLIITLLLDKDMSWFLINASLYKGWNHLWSVAEEARFYLLFPIVIGVLALLPNRLMRLLALGLMTWIAWTYRATHLIDLMDGRLVIFYFWMFLGGSMACFLYTAPEVKRLVTNRTARVLFNTSGLIILLFIFMSSDQMIKQFWHPLFPDLPKELSLNGWGIPGIWFYLFFFLLFGLTVFRNSWVSRWMQSWFLRHLGLLSYSLYLFHMPVLLELRNHFGFEHEGLFVAVFAVTYIIALLSYTIIEKPFLMLKPKSRKRPLNL